MSLPLLPRPDAPPGPLDARMRTAIKSVAYSAAALSVAALAVLGARAGLSAAIGGAVAAGNLWALARIVAALMPSSSEGAAKQSRAAWALLAALKMLGLVGVVWLLMSRGLVSPLHMLLGLGALPIGIAIGSLVSDRSAPQS